MLYKPYKLASQKYFHKNVIIKVVVYVNIIPLLAMYVVMPYTKYESNHGLCHMPFCQYFITLFLVVPMQSTMAYFLCLSTHLIQYNRKRSLQCCESHCDLPAFVFFVCINVKCLAVLNPRLCVSRYQRANKSLFLPRLMQNSIKRLILSVI